MLHGIINQQGNCLDVRDDISGKKCYFDIYSNKSLASGALEFIAIADNLAHELVLQML